MTHRATNMWIARPLPMTTARPISVSAPPIGLELEGDVSPRPASLAYASVEPSSSWGAAALAASKAASAATATTR
jgi:hypothetical protein